MEQWWNDTDRGKLKYWEKNLSNCKLFYCRSHVVWLEWNPGFFESGNYED
jgi:hypothetical protein